MTGSRRRVAPAKYGSLARLDPDTLACLFEDDHLFVAYKPSGMAAHRGWTREGPVALQTARDMAGTHLYLAHRLDRATSGALVFTKSQSAARALGDAFEAGHVLKRYVGLCRGRLAHQGLLDHPVPGTERGPRVPAQTWIRALVYPTAERCTVFEALLLTGRLHQIRRHLKHLSHPIVGDVRYGDGRINRHFRAEHEWHRLALHAWEIQLPHPVHGDMLTVTSPLPRDITALFRGLGIGDAISPAPGPWPDAVSAHQARKRPLPVR